MVFASLLLPWPTTVGEPIHLFWTDVSHKRRKREKQLAVKCNVERCGFSDCAS
jgi:hypothetical protein